MTDARRARVRAVLEKRQPDLTVLLEHVHKPHNLSAILRSCDAVGVLEAHAVALGGRVPTFNETSASADKWVPLHQHADAPTAIATLRERGFRVIATALTDTARDYRDIDYTRPTCLLLGAERWGVNPETVAMCDETIIVPMRGMVQSLNVSVAAAVVLFEASRQRQAAGLYDHPRLPESRMARLEYEWLYPREAALLRERGEDYPTSG